MKRSETGVGEASTMDTRVSGGENRDREWIGFHSECWMERPTKNGEA